MIWPVRCRPRLAPVLVAAAVACAAASTTARPPAPPPMRQPAMPAAANSGGYGWSGFHLRHAQPDVRQSAPDRGRSQQAARGRRSEEHTSELQSLMRISYAVFCLKKKKTTCKIHVHITHL